MERIQALEDSKKGCKFLPYVPDTTVCKHKYQLLLSELTLYMLRFKHEANGQGALSFMDEMLLKLDSGSYCHQLSTYLLDGQTSFQLYGQIEWPLLVSGAQNKSSQSKHSSKTASQCPT